MREHHLPPLLSVSHPAVPSPSASAFWDKTSPAASWSPFPPPSPCTVHKMLDVASQGSGESPLLEGLKSCVPTWGQCWVNGGTQ